MKKLLFILAPLIAIVLILSTVKFNTKPDVLASSCKTANAECNINDSEKLCCTGFTCMDHGVPSNNGKCVANPTATPTHTPTPTRTPTPTVTPSATPTPFHYGCIEHECVRIAGRGEDSCDYEWQEACQEQPTSTPTPTSVEPTPTGIEPTVVPLQPTGIPCTGSDCTPPSNEQHNYGSNQCTDSAPKTPTITWEGNPLPGCASFGLQQTDPFDTSTILYGYSKTNLLYSLVDIPRSGDILKTPQIITVCGLTPHVNIWGQICTYRNFCGSCSEVIDPILRH